MRRNGLALRYVSSPWRADREVVFAAVQQTGWALDYVCRTVSFKHEVAEAATDQAIWGAEAVHFIAMRRSWIEGRSKLIFR